MAAYARSSKRAFSRSSRITVARERGAPERLENSLGPVGSACSGLISLRRKEAIGCNLPPSNTWNSSRVRSATDCPRASTAATFSLVAQALGEVRVSLAHLPPDFQGLLEKRFGSCVIPLFQINTTQVVQGQGEG